MQRLSTIIKSEIVTPHHWQKEQMTLRCWKRHVGNINFLSCPLRNTILIETTFDDYGGSFVFK